MFVFIVLYLYDCTNSLQILSGKKLQLKYFNTTNIDASKMLRRKMKPLTVYSMQACILSYK